MILVCPSCETRYFAEDASMGPEGRRVRCAACGHSWTAKPSDPLESDAASPDAETGLTRTQVERLRQTASRNAESNTGPHAEIRAKDRERRDRNRKTAVAVAWLGGAVLTLGVFVGAVANRDQVVKTWPKSASLFKAAGFEVNRYGVELADIRAERSFDGTTPILTVTGRLQNVSNLEQAAPRIRIALEDEAGEEVTVWTATLDVEVIPSAGDARFRSQIDAPPLEAFNLNATLLDPPSPQPAPAAGPSALQETPTALDPAADQSEGEPPSASGGGSADADHAER